MASNHSFDPLRQPSRVPENFSQRPWGRELPLISPQVDAVFTSDFGWRRLYGRRDFHSGIDLAAAAGTAIYTPVAGEVLYVKLSQTDLNNLKIAETLAVDIQSTKWLSELGWVSDSVTANPSPSVTYETARNFSTTIRNDSLRR